VERWSLELFEDAIPTAKATKRQMSWENYNEWQVGMDMEGSGHGELEAIPLEGLNEITRNPVRIAGISDDIPIGHVQKTSQWRYRYTILIRAPLWQTPHIEMHSLLLCLSDYPYDWSFLHTQLQLRTYTLHIFYC
jgi:hypothetical protein